MIRQTYEDGAYVTFTYTDSGALAHTFDSETAITTTYTYDYAGRLQRYDEKGPNNQDRGRFSVLTPNTAKKGAAPPPPKSPTPTTATAG